MNPEKIEFNHDSKHLCEAMGISIKEAHDIVEEMIVTSHRVNHKPSRLIEEILTSDMPENKKVFMLHHMGKITGMSDARNLQPTIISTTN